VYASNTAGAIFGVLAAVHLGLPLLGVKGLIVAAAAIDLALAVGLLAAAPGRRRRAWTAGAVAVSAAAMIGVGVGVQLDPHHMASGVYRHGALMDPAEHKLVHHEDGKTTTVSVTLSKTIYSLRNNGTSDGSLNSAPDGLPTGDEATMALLGALPILMMPDARRVANIGFGTGLTAHALLSSDRLEILDTIEIEPAVVRGARLLMPSNRRAFEDPRSRVHIEDAKTFFSSQQVRYDVIVSEPSNPWVSGVASLFSAEFYRHVKRHLKDGGLFVQWVQLYEFSPQLLASVVAALGPAFSDYVIWLANEGDLIITAVNGGSVPELHATAFQNPAFAALLEPIRIRGLDDLRVHRLGSKKTMGVYFGSFGAEANSDFFPIIDLGAPKARFMKSSVGGPIALAQAPFPLLDLFEPGHLADPDRITQGARTGGLSRGAFAGQAAAAAAYLMRGDKEELKKLAPAPAGELIMLRASMIDCRTDVPAYVIGGTLQQLARLTLPYLPKKRAMQLWGMLHASRCSSTLPASERRWLRLYVAIAERSPGKMATTAAAVLVDEAGLTADAKAYALAALMSGQMLSGKRGAAVKAFQKYRGDLRPAAEWQPVFTFLSAHALGPMLAAPSGAGDNN
jgi:spermidine synthase